MSLTASLVAAGGREEPSFLGRKVLAHAVGERGGRLQVLGPAPRLVQVHEPFGEEGVVLEISIELRAAGAPRAHQPAVGPPQARQEEVGGPARGVEVAGVVERAGPLGEGGDEVAVQTHRADSDDRLAAQLLRPTCEVEL